MPEATRLTPTRDRALRPADLRLACRLFINSFIEHFQRTIARPRPICGQIVFVLATNSFCLPTVILSTVSKKPLSHGREGEVDFLHGTTYPSACSTNKLL